MISSTSAIKMLYEWRSDKMALVVFVALMGGDSILESWERLNKFLPEMQDIATRSEPRRKKDRVNVNNNIAKRVRDIAEEVEPWLRQLAERETGMKIGTVT